MTIKDNNTYISFDIIENIHQNIRLYKKLNAEKEIACWDLLITLLLFNFFAHLKLYNYITFTYTHIIC